MCILATEQWLECYTANEPVLRLREATLVKANGVAINYHGHKDAVPCRKLALMVQTDEFHTARKVI
jgi:hypothetical protein